MAAARARPVTLRDFLELGCDSSSDGFRSYPRCLPSCNDDALALQLLHAPAGAATNNNAEPDEPDLLRRSLFSLAARRPAGPGALATRISSLSRSFSHRIRDGFWRRHDHQQDDLYYFVDDRDSCGFPSPLVSSCSASDDSETDYDDADLAGLLQDEMPAPASDKPSSSSSSSSSSADHDRCTDAGAAADGKKKMQADGDPAVGRSDKLGMEDKQQLSPVSVLDFPFDDDDADERSDAGTCSPSFHRCPTQQDDSLHTRTTTAKQAQLLHKIRRYDDGIAQAVDPVDLEARFTTTSSDNSGVSADDASTTRPATTTTSSCSCSDTATTISSSSSSSSSSSATTTATSHGEAEEHQILISVDQQQPSAKDGQEEPEEYRLLAQLLNQEEDTAAAAGEVSLLLDFFAEGISDDRSPADVLVRAAAEWVRGAGPGWGIRDVMLSGKAALEDMERGRRWMCVADEERDVGAAVEGLLIDGLLDDLVADLLLLPP